MEKYSLSNIRFLPCL